MIRYQRRRRSLGAFLDDDGASISIETVLIVPVLAWAFLATFAFFDVFRAKGHSLKASYAISDLLSRETQEVDAGYIEGIESVFEYLTPFKTDAWIRVTVLRCHANCDRSNRNLKLDWSYGTDGVEALANGDLNGKYDAVIPYLAQGERLIMVETRGHYAPPFPQLIPGVTEQYMDELVLTRPRFAPQLVWGG
jgi:hypothetical protein